MTRLDELKDRKLELKRLLYVVCREIAEERIRLSSDGEIGNKYGLLTVTNLHEKRRSRKYFECLCECGTKVVVEMTQLRIGKTKSCGCLRSIIARNNIDANRTARRRKNRLGEFAE